MEDNTEERRCPNMRDRVDVKEKASKLTGMYEDEMMDM